MTTKHAIKILAISYCSLSILTARKMVYFDLIAPEINVRTRACTFSKKSHCTCSLVMRGLGFVAEMAYTKLCNGTTVLKLSLHRKDSYWHHILAKIKFAANKRSCNESVFIYLRCSIQISTHAFQKEV